jgi:hypothetical protein
MMSGQLVFNGVPDHLNPEVRALLATVSFEQRPTMHPEVFKYGINRQSEADLIYRYVFYGGSIVYAVSTGEQSSA